MSLLKLSRRARACLAAGVMVARWRGRNRRFRLGVLTPGERARETSRVMTRRLASC